MKTRILNGLEADLSETIEREFKTSHYLRKRLVELLNKDITSVQESMLNETAYNKASWPYFQADKLGEVKALQKLISLLE